MLTLVLATALTASSSAPAFGLGCSGCYGCYGCYGGYPYAVAYVKVPVSYGHGWGGSACFGGCFGGCNGGVYGCGGGYYGGGYNGWYSNWGTLYPAYAGCGGCCGSYSYAPWYVAPAVNAGPPVKVLDKADGVPEMKKVDDEKKGKDEEVEATVVVKAAVDVKVTVNGVAVPRRADADTFRTPALTPGESYSYAVVATATRGGKEVSETKRVPVAAGARAVADFTSLGAADAPAAVTILAAKGTKVRVNGAAVEIDGERTFDTPAMAAGREFFYTVETADETRRVGVGAGKRVTVDLRTKALAGR